MKIAVIAMGKIGLPMAVQFAEKGHDVIGVDIQADTVAAINRGLAPFPGEAQLQEKLTNLVPTGRLRATTDYAEAIPGVDVVVVLVPLVVNDETWEPDFTGMDHATADIAKYLTPGTLISYETTLPVGTLRNRFCPAITSISGLTEGKDFYLVFSPERVFTGRLFADLRRYPKLVGGLCPEGTRRGVEFYNQVLDFDDRPELPHPNGVWELGSAEAAELAKLAETTYRDVNIGLANEFAKYADRVGVDIYKIIDACNSQPFSHIHRPGIAVGGHCIPVYSRLYLATDPKAAIVRTARQTNMTMPGYAVQLLAKTMADAGLGELAGSTVAVLGVSFRGKVKETAFSGVFDTVAKLTQAGAKVVVHDPMFTAEEISNLGFTPYQEGQPVTVAVLQADHPEYLTWTPAKLPGVQVLLDGRNFTDPAQWPGVIRVAIGKTSS